MKLLLIHIPRTGGNSIQLNGHVDVVCFEHMFAKNIKDLSEYFSFAIVRNPYDRFLSSYHFYRDAYQNKRNIKNEIKKHLTFKDFVLNFKDFEYKNDHQFTPQWEFVLDENGKDIVNYIGGFEDLWWVWEKVVFLTSDRTSFESIPSLPVKNKTEHNEWKEEYTDEMKEIVYNLFEKDFEVFCYEK